MNTDKAGALGKADKLISQAEKLIPKTLEPNLPPTELIPDWHDFEHKIWRLGEELRQLIKENPTLVETGRDPSLLQRIVKICINRNAKRGRQSFIMIFELKQFSKFATDLATQLDDEFVNGHVVRAIQKMHVAGFDSEIKPFADHKHAWIRNAAKKYLTQKN